MTAVTTWESVRNAQGVRHDVTLSRVFEGFRTPRVLANKLDGTGWAPATFKGDYRLEANHELSYAVGLDVEKGDTRFETSVELWSQFWAFIHTTYRHTAEAHRLRVIIPTSGPVTAAEYRRVHRWLATQSNAAGQMVDPATKDPSRLWFTPAIPDGGEYLCHESCGEVLDVDAVLDMQPVEKPATRAVRLVSTVPTTRVAERARRYLARCPGAVSGRNGHTRTFVIAQWLVRGFLLDEATAFALLAEWNERCEPPWSEADLRRKVRQAMQGRLPEGTLLNARRCG